MKRVKSCSTLRLKVHQLLNEEEREILKYAIRIYRKNQSIDSLCDILSKIITDANRSCLVTLIADMLKGEQRSQFLSRCCMKMPSCSVSQQQLARPELPLTNNDYSSNTFSIRVATFVSKNRTNQSTSNLNLNKQNSKFEDNDSTLKGMINCKSKYSEKSNNNEKFKRSDSEELLKTIEKCTLKERPRLSNLQDKGFWRVNNGSMTDDDSIDSSSSICDKFQEKQISNGEKPITSVPPVKDTPRFHSNRKYSNVGLSNGVEKRINRLNSNSRQMSTPNPKVMISKLHFSSVNNIEDAEEKVDEIPMHLRSLATVYFNVNSSDNFFVQYQPEVPNYMSPTDYKPLDKLKCKSIDESINILSSTKSLNRVDSTPDLSKIILPNKIRKTSTDKGCQTSSVQTCDSSTQTFLA